VQINSVEEFVLKSSCCTFLWLWL